jgi:formylglycine-generating enzyme required for sulfatase activity
MAKIYISSTYVDLKEEREAAAQAVRRLGHQSVYMEDYVAAPQFPVDKCLQDVRHCDAYIGIFAWRYGFIPDGYVKSITHLEYETAKKAGIPCLIFLLDKKAPWPVEYVASGEERQKIDQLRNELMKKYIVSFFKNADELSGKVSPAVSNLISKSRKPGKDMEEVQAASKSIAIGIQKTGKEKLSESGEHEPHPGPKIDKVEIPTGRSEDFPGVPGAKKVYKNEKGFKEADYGDGIIMVYIPPGEFEMGSNDYDDEKPLHTVYLDGYWIGKYEVTFSQYDRYCDETGKEKPDDEGWERGKRPVINVSWYDAKAYCQWLSKKTGLSFKLPTEAQWEKAARGTDNRIYPWGNKEPDETLANFNYNLEKTTPVDSYPKGASPYGLLDMAGNVMEWCRDWYGKRYYQSSPDKNPTGPKSGIVCVLRGGSLGDEAVGLRCSGRIMDEQSRHDIIFGFRPCLDNK